ncbi:ankyrin repeat [Fusarium tjaetaba]|uniref:Ankyrin repeat n=1 Tax=Fusarium tjaetaba TaxID=1567544 RepID=A0A8H5S7W3_9HYPO|nr:ankyrin repeat [Fusarium tjaetaba]KAF5648445.1 ankyrin repeat [Fusarium tjaetaba]
MQFLSQSMGWADCIILAVAPLGIIITIVSAIRVDGPAWLKAIIGRSRENLSSAEMELMSSTSQETCELWNGRDVVRCQGKAPVTEFIYLAPVNSGGTIKRIRFMKLSEAIEQNLVIKGVFSVFNLSRLIHGVPKSRNHSSHYFQGGMRNLWGSIRSRRESMDPEVTTPIPLESRGQEAQPQSAPASELIVLRKTTTHAPNITLNRHHKVDRGHLHMVASFGILLQLGVLVYFGFITYYPTLKFKKDDKQVLGYAFPFSAGGTLVLVFGMLLCARVVDRSTTEDGYKPASGREMRMIWLQQKQVVSDQIFGSFALYPRRFPQVVTTSQRDTSNKKGRPKSVSSAEPLLNEASSTSVQSDDNEDASSRSALDSGPALDLTVVATGICLAGFIIQFIGLRAMHWSASVGQLIAVIIMTILRAFVRLGFIAPVYCSELRDGFELDGLALALGDPNLGPGSGPMNDVDGFDFSLSKDRAWTVVLKEKPVLRRVEGKDNSETGGDGNMERPAQGDDPNKDGLMVERRDNAAQETLNIRKHLAHLSGWRGSASKEANSLVEAIEVTMNTLCPWTATDPPTWNWSIKVETRAKGEQPKSLPVSIQLNVQNRLWRARIDELDSVLSLWLASIDKEREFTSSTAERSRIGDDDEWFRKRSSQIRGGLILLEEHTQALKQAFDWWLPTDAPKLEEIEDSQIQERYSEAWRVVGTKLCEGHYKSPTAEHSDEEEEEQHDHANDSVGSESGDKGECWGHIFHAFLWAAVSKMKAPIDEQSEMEALGSVIPGEWNNIRLRGTGLARLAGSIRSSGLMDLNHAYLTLVPPLDSYARLGDLDCVVKIVFGQAQQHEKVSNWRAAHDSYRSMLDLASQFREDSFGLRRTVAIVMEFMRGLALLPKVPEYGEYQRHETDLMHERLSRRLSESRYRPIRKELEMLYERQRRKTSGGFSVLTYSDRQQNEINSCGFTRLHDLVACPDIEDEVVCIVERMTRMRYFLRGNGLVSLGHVPQAAKKYVRTRDILGWTPLHYVTAWKRDQAPEWIDGLLSNGADIDAPDIRGWTPLHYSICNGNSRAFDRLVEKRANVKAAGVDGITPLHCAITSEMDDMARALISNPGQPADQFTRDNFGRMPIHLAAQNGNKVVINTLRLSVDEKDQHGRTALHLAALGGHLETLSKITEYGASPNETFQLFGRGPTYTALHWAVKESKTETVVMLLVLGASVNAQGSDGRTPLHYARIPDLVDILIEYGADVNAEAQSHVTPLYDAARSGTLECVDRLLKTPGCDINARPASDDEGPLLNAIKCVRGDIVRMLVEKGAIISQRMLEAALGLHDSREQETLCFPQESLRKVEDEEKDVAEYIRAAFSLRNAFEEHVHGEMGSIVLLELIRRLCPS